MTENNSSNVEFRKIAQISNPVLSRTSIYAILPSVRILIRIAGFFNVSIKYLSGESDDFSFYKSDLPSTFKEKILSLSEEYNVKFPGISHKMPFPYNYFYDWILTNTLPSLENLEALADISMLALIM